MKTSNSLVAPPAPNLVAALRAGFDAIANHISLILFPIALDLFLWMGPRLRLTQLIQSLLDQLTAGYANQDPAMAQLLSTGRQVWMEAANRFNLLAVLRSYPVGVPSLMASLSPLGRPIGSPLFFEVNSLGGVFLAWLCITLVGLVVGAFYFSAVAQVAISGQVRWHEALRDWPFNSLQIIYLALVWAALVILVSIPGSILLSLVLLGGLTAGQCALILYAGFVFWVFLPLLFSPHGIFVFHYKMYASVRASVNLTRKTLPTTILFLLAVFLLGQGLDLLWLVPAETSWLMLIGVLGHAFVATGLLAASFVYYKDADRWMREVFSHDRIATVE